MIVTTNHNAVQNTTHKAVIPFYLYAALSFLAATVMLVFSGNAFTKHYFNQGALAITHTMALGWGTMIILGASHQLLPVLIEGKLFSNRLAYVSFILAGTGIPFLVSSFFRFDLHFIAQAGGIQINAAILCFLVNAIMSMKQSKSRNVHAVFLLTATGWLLVTSVIGWLLLFNFTKSILPRASLYYLSLHAHTGIIGWFLLVVTGVGSRLIPLFLISKYDNRRLLWWIYCLINVALVIFIFLFFSGTGAVCFLLPLFILLIALALFARYCFHAYSQRIRKQVDAQVRISLLSVLMMAVPLVLVLCLVLMMAFSVGNVKWAMAYGFTVFFGWLTAIILGMTFKTLPFIVWNKVYHDKAAGGKTPNPKDLFSEKVFHYMGIAYLAGFCLFIPGVIMESTVIIQTAGILLLAASLFYNYNVIRLLLHKPTFK